MSLPRHTKEAARPVSGAHVWRGPSNARRLKPKEHPRTRRRKRLAISLIFLILFVGVSIAATEWVLHHEAVRFSHAEVRGILIVPREPVQGLVDTSLKIASERLFPRDNILLFDTEALALQLEDTYPRIANADVHAATFLHPHLIVNIQERSPHALWCSSGGECYLMDARGVVFGSDTGEARALPTIFYEGSIATTTAIGSIYAPGAFDSIKRFLLMLHQRNVDVISVAAQSSGEVIYQMRNFEVRTKSSTNPEELLSTLELALSSQALRDDKDRLEYIDLRFGNRVYFKLSGEETPTEAE
jgi:cell division septal protein FtsQ